MNRPRVRVIIADDHPVIHQGVEACLFADPHVALVDSARDFAALRAQLAQVEADVVVLDLTGMGVMPIPMVKTLKREFPRVHVLVFSSSVDFAPEILAAGALGYVVKEELLGHLSTAIQTVAAGNTYRSPLVEAYMERSASFKRKERLAPRELAVLKLVADGLTTPQISEALEIDGRTAQYYIGVLFEKTGTEGRPALARWYRDRYGDEA